MRPQLLIGRQRQWRRRPRRRCINSSFLSLRSNFSTLLFFAGAFSPGQCKINLKCTPPPAIAAFAARKFPFMEEKKKITKKEETVEVRKRPSQTRCPPSSPLPPPLFPSYRIVQLTVSIMWRGSHLIKLVQAVQSLKRGEWEGERRRGLWWEGRKKNCTYVRESGQIIKYKLISVLISVFRAMNCIWKIKKDMTAAPRSPPCNLLAESSKREVGGEEEKEIKHYVNMAAWIFFVLFLLFARFGNDFQNGKNCHIRTCVPFGKCV